MSVSAIGAVSSSVTNVYAALSPYLNGIVRTSDAARAAQAVAASHAASAAATTAAIAARSAATAAATAAPPFANPAIVAIGVRSALGQAATAPQAVTPAAPAGTPALAATPATPPLAPAGAADTAPAGPVVAPAAAPDPADALTTPQAPQQPSPFAQTAYGDSGELIQSYGAIALTTVPQLLPASAFAQPATPAIPAPAPIARIRKAGATA